MGRHNIKAEHVGGLPLVPTSIAVTLGLVAGLAFAGWTLSGDLLLNWDQVIGERIPVPPGFYGEGPELPRRLPLYVLLSAFSQVLPGPAVVGLLFIGSTIAAVVGVHRRAGNDLAALVVAVGYSSSPFVLTRGAVGHLPVVVAAAMVPWALDAFESGERRRILTWAVAFGLTGPTGAVIGLVPAALAIMWPSSSARRSKWPTKLRDLFLLVATQLSWLAPGLVVLSGQGSFPSSPTSAFATRADGIVGWFQLATGGGFFIGTEDVASRAGLIAAVLGAVVLVGGIFGLVNRSQFDLVVKSAVVAAVMILASIESVGSIGWQPLTKIGPLGIVRDAQKFWPLVGLGLAVGLAGSFRQLAAKASRPTAFVVVPIVAALYVGSAGPGLFGAGGRLVADEAPAEWKAIESALAAVPAASADEVTLSVVLPWVRYERLDLSKDRNVLQPAPWLIPSRVLISGDPGLGAGDSERNDPLDERMDTLDLAVRSGASIAPNLEELRVTHVLVAGSSDSPLYRRIGNEDGVEVLVEEGDYSLYQISNQATNNATLDHPTTKRSTLRTLLAGGPTILFIAAIAFQSVRAISSFTRHRSG